MNNNENTFINGLTNIIKKRWYPVAPQIIVTIIFAFILRSLLFGPAEVAKNPGAIIVWLLWWPLIPITFIFLGRIWCSVCPFGAIGDWLRRRFGLNRKPPAWLKKYGIWIVNGLFFLVTWYEVTFGLTKSVSATAVLFLIVLAAAAVFSVLFERRTWCRYVCFLGGVFGNYAQAAAVELRGNKEACLSCSTQNCYNGNGEVEGCALFISPKTLSSNRTCNFCGDCLKTCANDSPRIVVREKMGRELWQKRSPRFDESFLAVSLMGAIFISTMGMLVIWPPLVGMFTPVGIFTKQVIVTLYLIALVAIGLGAYALGAFFSAKVSKEKFRANFGRFGYGLIPLNLATHIAHNMMHFLGEGRLIGEASLDLFSPAALAAAKTASSSGVAAGHDASSLVPMAYIQPLQFIIVALGILLSLYVIKRIAGRDGRTPGAWPHYIVVGLFGLVGFWLFSLPMMMRH